MSKQIKKTEHNGETYYALESIIAILENSNNLDHFSILLFPDNEDYQIYKDDKLLRNDKVPFLP